MAVVLDQVKEVSLRVQILLDVVTKFLYPQNRMEGIAALTKRSILSSYLGPGGRATRHSCPLTVCLWLLL